MDKIDPHEFDLEHLLLKNDEGQHFFMHDKKTIGPYATQDIARINLAKCLWNGTYYHPRLGEYIKVGSIKRVPIELALSSEYSVTPNSPISILLKLVNKPDVIVTKTSADQTLLSLTSFLSSETMIISHEKMQLDWKKMLKYCPHLYTLHLSNVRTGCEEVVYLGCKELNEHLRIDTYFKKNGNKCDDIAYMLASNPDLVFNIHISFRFNSMLFEGRILRSVFIQWNDINNGGRKDFQHQQERDNWLKLQHEVSDVEFIDTSPPSPKPAAEVSLELAPAVSVISPPSSPLPAPKPKRRKLAKKSLDPCDEVESATGSVFTPLAGHHSSQK